MPILVVVTDHADTAAAVSDAVTRWVAGTRIVSFRFEEGWFHDVIGRAPCAVLLEADTGRMAVAACRRLRSDARTAGVPVIAVVARDQESSADALIPLADAIVARPVSPMVLAGQIRAVLRVGGRWSAGANDARYHSIFENTGTATAILDGDDTVNRINREFERLSGYTKDEVEGRMAWTRFVHPDDISRLKAYHVGRRRFHPGVPGFYEFRFVDRQGRTLPILLRAGMIQGTGQSVVSLMDISDRREAEEALRASEERYRTILESIEEGYFEVDLAGNFSFVNTPLCKMVGRSRESILGINNREYTSSETAAELLRLFNRVYETGKPSGLNRFRIDLDHRTLFVEITASLITDAEGRTAGFRGIVREVTERIHDEEKQRVFERLQGVLEMAGAVCHEVNQPLQSIMGYAELMRMDISDSHRHFSKINKIIRQIDRINDITTKLQKIARYETLEYIKGSKIIDIHKSAQAAPDVFQWY